MREDLIREDWFGEPQPRQFQPPPSPTTLDDVSNLFDQGPGFDESPSPPGPPSITTQPLPRTNSDPFAGLPVPAGYHAGPQGQFLPSTTQVAPGTTINAGKPIQPQLNALFPNQPWPANSPYRNPAPAGQETSPYYTHPQTTVAPARPGDVAGATQIFFAAMQAAGLDPVAVQGHGQQIADAINAYAPGSGVTIDPRTDAVIWPGIGPVDVTIDSGKGGWSFRPDSGGGGAQPAFQGAQGSQNPGGTYSATNPFDDPATKNYIDFLNSRIQQLLQPYNNPDAGPLQEWMRKYFAQLQGPTYTPAQQGTIQTQALDPIEQQRQAELKNVAYVMASRGITPGSGPYLQAERDINLKYDQIRAQIQGGLAVNEINLGRQNQAQAANVGGQLAQFTQGLFGSQEARANQALGLAQEIPNLAQQRIAQAVNLLQGSNVNPAQLLQSLQGFQQQGIGQSNADAAFYAQLFATIAKQFGLG